MKWEDVTEDTKRSIDELAKEIGQFARTDIYNDGRKKIYQVYENIKDLKDMDRRTWIHQRNSVVRSFLHGCTGVNNDHINEKKIRCLASTIEHVYHLGDLNLITSFSFLENLISYCISGSKLICQIHGASSGSGSYSSVHKVITAPCPPNPLPHGVIVFCLLTHQFRKAVWRVFQVVGSICLWYGKG